MHRTPVLLLFLLTLFLSAFLLFCVQPMIAKMVLPLLGGSPAVWSTCMVFFQAALLAGYAYAHATTTWLGVRRQTAVQAGLLLLPLFVLPFGIPPDAARSLSPEANPTGWLFMLLLGMVALPFFVVATSAPLLQRWFAQSGHPAASDPYFLYGASNLGSMLALLAYPLVVEPNLRLAEQSMAWTFGYGLYVVLALGCLTVVRRGREIGFGGDDSSEMLPKAQPLEVGQVLRWVVLAFIPTSLMLGVTMYLTTDIAAIPLLWVIPLALYLLTFIITFARQPILPSFVDGPGLADGRGHARADSEHRVGGAAGLPASSPVSLLPGRDGLSWRARAVSSAPRAPDGILPGDVLRRGAGRFVQRTHRPAGLRPDRGIPPGARPGLPRLTETDGPMPANAGADRWTGSCRSASGSSRGAWSRACNRVPGQLRTTFTPSSPLALPAWSAMRSRIARFALAWGWARSCWSPGRTPAATAGCSTSTGITSESCASPTTRRETSTG